MKPANSAAAEPEMLHKEPTPAPDALAEVTAQVQADARDDPEAYLADTVVSEGGE